MPILPVLDVRNGQVVRGVAGRRAEYRPIVSRLVDSAEPLAVARALRAHLGCQELYLADLDAIAGAPPALALYGELQAEGFRLWVDAGLRSAADAEPLRTAGVASVIAGLETLAGPALLEQLCRELGLQRLVFSLDLKEGQPLGAPEYWPATDGWGIAQLALAAGVRRLLVLDLAHVGIGSGVGTEALCAQLYRHDPALQLVAGGGVRGPEDVRRLYAHGVQYVLVASALHDGRICNLMAEPLKRDGEEG
jgi:phosphoribosylformimino-5-aminoimidazole carboxamide ribotide isomerase